MLENLQMELILSEIGWSQSYGQRIATKGTEKGRQESNTQTNTLPGMKSGEVYTGSSHTEGK